MDVPGFRLLFRSFPVFFALPHRVQTIFAALGPIGGALGFLRKLM